MAEESKKIVLTSEGLKNLEDELENLKVVRRKEVAAKIKEDSGKNNRPAPIQLMTDEGIPSLGNGMFVK